MSGPRSSVAVCDPGHVFQCVTQVKCGNVLSRSSAPVCDKRGSDPAITHPVPPCQPVKHLDDTGRSRLSIRFLPGKSFHPGSTGRDGKAIETMVNGKLGLTQADNTE